MAPDTAQVVLQRTPDAPFKILDLPPELVILILRRLDWRSILQCSATCKFLHGLTQTAEIRYLLELAYDGLLPQPGWSKTPIHTCLAAMRARREAFRNLQWKTVTTVPVPGPCQAYELVGGVFAKSMTGQGMVLSPGSRHFLFSWLPTAKGPLQAPAAGVDASADATRDAGITGTSAGSTLIRPDIGIATRDFAIDPTQDLIALIEYDDGPTLTSPHAIVQIHLRTLSTNVPHPETTCPLFRHVTPFRIGNAFIQIVDDVVGLFFWAEGPGLLIWSWKDGRVCVYQTEPELSPSAWDFSFLSPRAYMVTYTGSPGFIEIFTFTVGDEAQSSSGPVLTDSSAGLNPYDVTDETSPKAGPLTTPTHVAMLLLPPLQSTVPLVNFSTHTGPYLAHPPYTSAPFYTDVYTQRMHVMTLRYHVDHFIFRFILYVHNSMFMDLIRKRREVWEPTGFCSKLGKVILRWSEWGRENTRMHECHWDFHWLRYVYGSRVVLPPERILSTPSVPGATFQRISVLDFNVRSHQPRPSYLREEDSISPSASSHTTDPDAADQSHSPERDNVMVETSSTLEPSRIVCEMVFKDPVETALPYYAVTRTIRTSATGVGAFTGSFHGFMIDEERLIGMKSTALSEGDMGEVTVFAM